MCFLLTHNPGLFPYILVDNLLKGALKRYAYHFYDPAY